MKYYFAPMEGITGYVFRSAHHLCFSGTDRYYTPFLAPRAGHRLTGRETGDILPKHNQGIALVPQILSCRAEDFVWACRELAGYGYKEVNLNLGCPFGTVTAKGKGAGFLADPEALKRFFDKVFSMLSSLGLKLGISVKTRAGMESGAEFPGLLEIYNQYPICELILHPRVRSDFYEGRPRMEIFRLAEAGSRNPLCYNGDICSKADFEKLRMEFPDLPAIMIGRGAVASPWLMEQLGEAEGKTENEEKDRKEEKSMEELRLRFLKFHDLLLSGYQEQMSGDRNVLFKMKELWLYFGCHFPEGKKELKQIKKARSVEEYQSAARALFEDGRFEADAFCRE